jgi:hypothetical protein
MSRRLYLETWDKGWGMKNPKNKEWERYIRGIFVTLMEWAFSPRLRWKLSLTVEDDAYQNCTTGRITYNDQYRIVINPDTKITALYFTYINNCSLLQLRAVLSSYLVRWGLWGPRCGLPASPWRSFRLTPASGQCTGVRPGVQGVKCQPHHGGHSDWPLHQVSTQGSKVWNASLTMEVIQTDPCIRSVHRGPKYEMPASPWRSFRLTPASGQYTVLRQNVASHNVHVT